MPDGGYRGIDAEGYPVVEEGQWEGDEVEGDGGESFAVAADGAGEERVWAFTGDEQAGEYPVG